MPLRIEGRDEASPPGTDFILAAYGRVVQLAAHRSQSDGGAAIDRALLSLGRAIERPDAARAERPGLWMRGELPALNVDDWIAVRAALGVARIRAAESGLPLAGADFDVHQFDAMGARFTDLKLRVREAPKGWAFDIDGPEVAGTASWSRAGRGGAQRSHRRAARADHGAGPRQRRVVAQRRRQGGRQRRASDAPAANPWPEIDLAADALDLEGARSRPARVRRAAARAPTGGSTGCVLANDAGQLEASGAWRVAGRAQQTKLDIVLDAKDSGAFIARYGYAEGSRARRRGSTVSSHGRARRTNSTSTSLNGKFRIHVGSGPLHQARTGSGQAARRAVAAGAAATRHARLQRRVQRRVSRSTTSPAT